MRSPLWHGRGIPHGQGQPVLLVCGLFANDGSLSLMAKWLKRCGYRPRRAGISWNIDCSEATMQRLEQRLEQLYQESGQKVVIIGQSRGGLFARALAVRHPEMVDRIITLGSPHLLRLANPQGLNPLLLWQVELFARLGTLGVIPSAFSRDCLQGGCCSRFEADLDAPFPASVGFVSIFSKSDGVVPWQACLDPDAQPLKVSSSHCGMSVNKAVYRIVADELAQRQAQKRRARRAASRSRKLGHGLGTVAA